MKVLRNYFIVVAVLTLVTSCSTLLTQSQLSQKKIYLSLDQALANPDDVYVLDIEYSTDTIQPEDLLPLKNLQGLEISAKIDLDTFPGVLSKLKNLQWITINNNNISYVSDDILSFKHLKELDLSSDRIKKFPDINRKNKMLLTLSLCNDGIDSIPPDISNLKNLENLSLNNNKLKTLPIALGNLKDIKTLVLSNNRLKYLPDNICDLKQLSLLDLANNQLQQLPDSIKKLHNSLQFLKIYGNGFSSAYCSRIRHQLLNTKVYDNAKIQCIVPIGDSIKYAKLRRSIKHEP